MSDSLATYLHDHLAGANFAIELLEFLRDRHVSASGEIATLLTEIDSDRAVLQTLIERAGEGGSVMKTAAAWLAEKLSRIKLSQGDLGTFQAFETLAMGILGKRALWQALKVISDSRLNGIDFERLMARAEDQYTRAEGLRLVAARRALGDK
jgi:hypothetical protein